MTDDLELSRGQRILLRMLGLNDEEIETLWNTVHLRLREVKALIHGGELADGGTVEGLAAQEARLKRLEDKLDEILKLAKKVGVEASS